MSWLETHWPPVTGSREGPCVEVLWQLSGRQITGWVGPLLGRLKNLQDAGPNGMNKNQYTVYPSSRSVSEFTSIQDLTGLSESDCTWELKILGTEKLFDLNKHSSAK